MGWGFYTARDCGILGPESDTKTPPSEAVKAQLMTHADNPHASAENQHEPNPPTPAATPPSSAPPPTAEAAPSSSAPPPAAMAGAGKRKVGSLAERARLAVEAELKAKAGASAADKMVQVKNVVVWTRRLLAAVVIVMTVYLFVRFDSFRFPDSYVSMQPAFQPNQSVYVDRLLFPGMIDALPHGEVVIFVVPKDGKEYSRAARIHGRPGDLIALETKPFGRVFTVNGKPIMGPTPGATTAGVGRVPEGHFFVLEDSPDHADSAFDSRDFGFLPFENVRGKIALWWPTAAPASGAPARTSSQ